MPPCTHAHTEPITAVEQRISNGDPELDDTVTDITVAGSRWIKVAQDRASWHSMGETQYFLNCMMMIPKRRIVDLLSLKDIYLLVTGHKYI